MGARPREAARFRNDKLRITRAPDPAPRQKGWCGGLSSTDKASEIPAKARHAVVPQRFKNWTLPRLIHVRMLDAGLAKALGLTKP